MFEDPNAIVLNVGVNNVKSESVTDICTLFAEVDSVATNSFPREAKILVSHVTPRKDELDLKVKEVNNYLLTNEFLKKFPELQVSVIRHDNLDTGECLHDCKHLSKKTGIRRFAGNIKNALRQAFGLGLPNQRRGYSGNHPNQD